jgi:branched-chain amino acid transport system substrate-binding protein
MNREGVFVGESQPKWWLLAAILAAVLLLGAGCGGDEEAAAPVEAEDDAPAEAGQPSGEPIVIGAAIAQTGIIAPFDGPALNGATLAVEEINERGGVLGRPLEIVVADTASDINQGARAGLEVIGEGADAMLVSPDYNFGGGAAREAQQAGIVVFSSSAGSPRFGVQGIGDMAFTMGIAATTDGAVAAEWGYEEQGYRTAYMLVDDIADYNRDQCRGFETRWEELGGELLGSDTFSNDDPSIAPQITRLTGLPSEPDFIILCSFPPGGATAIKQLRDAGVDVPIISQSGFEGDFWYRDSMPDLRNFFYIAPVSLWGDDPSDQANEFAEKYRERWEQPQAVSAIGAYAAVYAIAEAMEATGTTEGAAVAGEIEQFDRRNVGGIEVSFSETAHIDLDRELRIIEIDRGEHRLAAVRSAENQLAVFDE